MQPTLRRIELPVADVPQVHLPQLRIGFSHALQDADGANPKQHGQPDTPQRAQTETQGGGDERSAQNQLAVTPKQLIGSVYGGVNDDTSR
jgi:hypothetical protein